MAVEALELARTADRYEPQVLALSVSAMLAGLAGDTPLEIAHHEERLALARRRGDRSRIADSLNTLAEIELDEGTSGERRSPGRGGARPWPARSAGCRPGTRC